MCSAILLINKMKEYPADVW